MRTAFGGKFTSLDATYLDLTPATANIHYIQDEVEKVWPGHEVVSSDGLRIMDSEATRGWWV